MKPRFGRVLPFKSFGIPLLPFFFIPFRVSSCFLLIKTFASRVTWGVRYLVKRLAYIYMPLGSPYNLPKYRMTYVSMEVR
ncbi:hypothetical protein F4810DRAFT_318684 [Camillea tinctor]|nr:hypothetical protein F4810DRAFT_318684 [Camillea tinctor]